LATLTHVLKRHYKYPLYSLPSSLIDTLTFSLPLPLVSHFFGIRAAGYFALVQWVIALPLGLIGGSVADVFHSRVAAYAQDRRQNLRILFLQTARGLLLLGAGPAILLAVFAPWGFRTIFGPSWLMAGELAVRMAPLALAQLIVSPLSRIVFVLGGQELKLLYDGLALTALLAAMYSAHWIGLSLPQSVALLSTLQVLAYGMYFLLLLRRVTAFQESRH
jgi:lipopolysaccharide exporter